LKSAMNRHHQMLGIFPGDALPGLYCSHLQFLLVEPFVALAVCLGLLSCCMLKCCSMSLEAFGFI
jgi:hypothetical protein